jgi:DNA mismatch endonuclease (patch repair protein)
MSGIRGKDTLPELLVRKALHAVGFRYRLHDRTLPGKPDMVFPKYSAVVFINGCFWHGHDCHLFRMPSTRTEFWQKKITGNVARDQQAVIRLREIGWRVGTVWGCALKGREKLQLNDIVVTLDAWLRGEIPELEIKGHAE